MTTTRRRFKHRRITTLIGVGIAATLVVASVSGAADSGSPSHHPLSAAEANFGVLRSLSTTNDRLPVESQDSAADFAQHYGFDIETIRALPERNGQEIYLASGSLKDVPTVCVVAPRPGEGISATCNSVDQAVTGHLIGALAGDDGQTIIYKLVADSDKSAFTVGDEQIDPESNLAITVAPAGTTIRHEVDGEPVVSRVAGEPKGAE